MRLNQRQENILLSLKRLGFLSRSQIQRLHRLGSVRNANRVLAVMAPLLHSVRIDENVYYLNADGREYIGANKALKRTSQIEHYLMRNQLYIARGCPATWRNEIKLAVPGEVTVIADAVYTMAGRYFICEIDREQKMRENAVKIERYRRLIDLGVFELRPKFIWLTTTEFRRKELRRLCEGLDVTVYTTADIK